MSATLLCDAPAPGSVLEPALESMLESGLESGLGDYLALGPDPIVRELTSAARANVIDLLTAMDGVDHVAYGALAAGRCVGAARFIRATSRPRSAEVAVTVAPEFRSRGIARLLVTALEQRAESCAIDTFEVNIYPENRGASALFRSLGFDTRFEGGVITGERSLGSLL